MDTTTPHILQQLFPALESGAFVRDYYPTRPYVAHASAERLGALARWPAWDDPATLVDSLGGEMVIGYTRSEDGRPSQDAYPREYWRPLYESGATVELLASHQPQFRALCDNIAIDLGIAKSLVSADVFLSPCGEAVPKHFDGVDVIVMQLRGCKRWQLAPNPALRFPAHAYIPGFGADIRNHRDMAQDGPPSYPLEMLEDAQTIMMNPGSALFVPRGWWHQTSAVTDSVSISIVTRPPTTGDIIRTLVERSVLTRSDWREPVAVGSSNNLAALHVRLTTLLEQLKVEASRVSYDHAYALRRFHRCSGVTIDADGSGDEPWTVTITRRGAGSTQMTVPSYAARLFAWVANTCGVFGSTEPLPLFPPGCGEWIESELKMMEQMKVIESVNM